MRQKLFDKAEELEWSIYVDEDGEIEFSKYSPAGEDFSFHIEGKNIVQEVKEYACNFDADEHAEMWVNSRGKNGVPDSIRTLIDDADAIQTMLDELAETLEIEENKQYDPIRA